MPLPNVGKCKLCGCHMINEEIIEHLSTKHKKVWLRSLKEEEEDLK